MLRFGHFKLANYASAVSTNPQSHTSKLWPKEKKTSSTSDDIIQTTSTNRNLKTRSLRILLYRILHKIKKQPLHIRICSSSMHLNHNKIVETIYNLTYYKWRIRNPPSRIEKERGAHIIIPLVVIDQCHSYSFLGLVQAASPRFGLPGSECSCASLSLIM